jgi:UPF0755 protein
MILFIQLLLSIIWVRKKLSIGSIESSRVQFQVDRAFVKLNGEDMKKLLIALVLVVLGAGAVVGGLAIWVHNAMGTPHQHAKAGQWISIERGTAPAAVIGNLVSEGIIADGTPVLIYLRTVGDASKLEAGDYQFPSPITPTEVLDLLENGTERTTRLTIPEGFTMIDIRDRIQKFKKDAYQGTSSIPISIDMLATWEYMKNTSLIKDLAPEAKNLEGYMFPSTYEVDPKATPQQMIDMMVNQFRKVWKPEWTEKARAMRRTPHEIVTIASLVETESKFDAERPIVASVIYNRLSKSIPLGIDQTNVYIAKMEGRWDGTIHKSDLEVESPYNTRKRAGLPPGPISSVSVSAIEAALNPAQTDYIFYVLNVQANDGSHHFFASASDFERAKADYQRWLEQQRQEKRANEANNANLQQ